MRRAVRCPVLMSARTRAYGVDDIALSMPAIVGSDGVETLVPLKLNADETARLQASVQVLKDILAQNEI